MSRGRFKPAMARKLLPAFLRALPLLLIPAMGIASGCASVRALDLSAYPEKTRKLYLFNFTNNTFQPDANRELTNWVRAEFNRRGNFKLTSEQDDARLQVYGRIVVYRKEGRLFDNFRRAVRSELIVVCRLSIRQNPRRIDSPPTSPLLETREVSAGVDFSEFQGFRETEFQARARLLRLLASRINNAVERAYKAHFPAPPPTPVRTGPSRSNPGKDSGDSKAPSAGSPPGEKNPRSK